MDSLLTEAQVAEILQLKVRTIQSWRLAAKHLPFIKLGGAVRYRMEDIQQYLDDHVVLPNAKGGA